MTAKLHCFGESGNAYKAALTLQLAGVDWEPVFVDFFNGGTRRAEFLALNPMGEVPVLDWDGRVLTQSGAIQMLVAESTSRFLGTDVHETRRWLFWDNHKMSSQAGTLRFLTNFVPPDRRPDPAVLAWLSGRFRPALKVLEGTLATRDWVTGAEPTIADFACCGYLFYPEPFGFTRADWPHIDRWLAQISALPGWKHPYELMPGTPSDRA